MLGTIRRIIDSNTWDLGIIDTSDPEFSISSKWKIKYIKSPFKNLWFADPFILSVSDSEINILAEACPIGVHKGFIAKITIDRKTYKIVKKKSLLELDSHLSFPAILRLGEEIYLYPENSASGKNKAYRYDSLNESLTYVGDVINEPLTDPIISEFNGKWYVLTTRVHNDNGNLLEIYQSDNPLSCYKLIQTISFDKNWARNAGAIFNINNKKYRPSQDCEGGYGLGIVFQEIQLVNNKFILNFVSKKIPPKGYDGMHTFNMFDGLAVVDLRRNLYPRILLIYNLLSKIKHTIKFW